MPFVRKTKSCNRKIEGIHLPFLTLCLELKNSRRLLILPMRILAVGGIVEKPVVKNGQIVPGNTMKVTLSCDHRVVDGVVGSAFLNTFKAFVENPVVFLGAQNI